MAVRNNWRSLGGGRKSVGEFGGGRLTSPTFQTVAYEMGRGQLMFNVDIPPIVRAEIRVDKCIMLKFNTVCFYSS